MKIAGNRLKEAMRFNEMTYSGIAKLLNVSISDVFLFTNEQKEPSTKQVFMMAQITNFPVKHFTTSDKHEIKCEGIFF